MGIYHAKCQALPEEGLAREWNEGGVWPFLHAAPTSCSLDGSRSIFTTRSPRAKPEREDTPLEAHPVTILRFPLPSPTARAVGPNAVRVRRPAEHGRRARAGRDVCVCTERVAVASSPSPSEGCIRSVGGVEVLILGSRRRRGSEDGMYVVPLANTDDCNGSLGIRALPNVAAPTLNLLVDSWT